MTKSQNRYLLLLIPAALFLSCGRNVVFTDSYTMKGKTWEVSDIPVFKVLAKDTAASNNIFFTIRTGSSYPFRNLYLFVTTSSPEGKSITDTLQYNIADEKGKWLGRGFGDIHELILPYKSDIYFPVKGTYIISVQHGMRMKDLRGVYDFGLRVEKTGKQ